MSNLPSEMIAEVLSRVPAMSLLRFRCVSKSWLALIDSPEFIKSHLNRTIENNSDRKLILYDDSYFSAELNVLDRNHDAQFSIFEELNNYLYRQIVGSCNGLLCLEKFCIDEVEIWNLTTRNVVNLPSIYSEEDLCDASSENSSEDYFSYGFGYDRLSDDYKVLCILSSDDDGDDCEARVFSVKSNSWRRVGSFPSLLNDHPGILVAGALHWVVRKPDSEQEYLVAAFDLGTEEYRLVELPYYYSVNEIQPSLFLLGESLCFCNDVEANPVEFWVMKTCEGIDSWTMLCSVSYPISRQYHRAIPIAYSSDGRQVVISVSDYLFWYDLHTERIMYSSTFSLSDHPEFRIVGDVLDFHIWFGSLVRLGGEKSISVRPRIEAVLGDER